MTADTTPTPAPTPMPGDESSELSESSPVRLARRAAFVEDVAWMATTGETHVGAAARLHVRPGSLCHALTRAGRPDLWRLLMANTNRPSIRTAKPTTNSTGRAA
ncbi:hypothetical protein ACIB24_04250 [Spongisporangium articulatum]|uniref:Uncharacterized protein n=1 Tax=Spongisporangium articulatum TaxID=3362603 RepID=A0ABW8AIR9_9ACTN